MKVTLLQRDIVWADPQRNAELISKELERLRGSDLYVLPEMFSTGFITGSVENAETEPCASLEKMKEWAAKYDCAIAGSIALHTSEGNRNRFYFVKPDGSVTFYDKRHLFTYGGEHHRFTGGDERVIVEWRGMRFLLLVCYDLRFPVWARNRRDYDAIICVANWPAVRSYAWDTLVRARAIENQCFMLAVNRAGEDSVGPYKGGSVILEPHGEIVAACEDFRESSVTAEIRMEDLEAFRKAFPVMDDADGFKLG